MFTVSSFQLEMGNADEVAVGFRKSNRFYLEDFNLASGDVEAFGGAISVAVRVGLDLDAEGDAFLAAVFLRREFGADAIDFDVDADLFGRIPNEFDHIQVAVVLDDVVDAVR